MGRIVLLTGARGGIGSELLAQLVDDPTVEHVFATGRLPTASQCERVTWLTLDLRATPSIQSAAQRLADTTKRIDWFISATGLLHEGAIQPEKRLDQIDPETLDLVYRVNASGPLALLGACMPLLKTSTEPKVAVLSAQIGSIGDNRSGGWSAYRMAKAALNMGLKNAAIEAARWRHPGTVVAVHPGTTLTNLSEPYVARRKQPVREAAVTARLIAERIVSIDTSDNGRFMTAEGQPLPW